MTTSETLPSTLVSPEARTGPPACERAWTSTPGTGRPSESTTETVIVSSALLDGAADTVWHNRQTAMSCAMVFTQFLDSRIVRCGKIRTRYAYGVDTRTVLVSMV